MEVAKITTKHVVIGILIQVVASVIASYIVFKVLNPKEAPAAVTENKVVPEVANIAVIEGQKIV